MKAFIKLSKHNDIVLKNTRKTIMGGKEHGKSKISLPSKTICLARDVYDVLVFKSL